VPESTKAELLDAVKRGDETVALGILQRHPDLRDVRDEHGVSLPLVALYHGRPEAAVRLLAGREADLFEAAALGDATRLATILASDRGAPQRVSADGFTPLHLSAYFGQVATARLLLEAGADVGAAATNASAVRPLHCACATGQDHGAPGRLEVARLLLERGAPVDAVQRGGFTALHSRALHGDVAFVRLLVAHGADPSRGAEDRRTPLGMAEGARHAEVVRILQGAGSRPGS
jgi:ankyrin repeat protein